MFTPKTFTLPDGEVITYGVAGQPNGPLMLLLPGQKTVAPGLLGNDFIPEQVEYLAPYFKVIYWNYRVNNFPGEKANVVRMAKDVLAFLEAEQIENASVLGYSYGGMVAARLAYMAPQRLKAMIMLNTFPYLSFHFYGFNLMTLRFLVHLLALPGHTSSYLRECMMPRFRQKPGGYHGPFGKALDWLGHHGLDWLWNHMWTPRIWSALKDDVRSILPEIATPTLVIAGRADATTQVEAAEQFHHGLKNSELKILEDAGHYTVRVWPEAFNRPIRDFIAQQYDLPADALPIPHRQPPAPLGVVRLARTLVVQYWHWLRSRFR